MMTRDININVQINKSGSTRRYLICKRIIDVATALVLSVLLAVPMLIVAVLIRCTSPGPAIFRQDRMGKDGSVFSIYKFRTMRVETPSDVASVALKNADQYLTGIGRFLRYSSMDELPQLWNILRGDMSFVGYRPVCLSEVELNGLRQEMGVFACLPGITGYAQVNGRDRVTIQEKAKLDQYYVTHISLRMDLLCIWRTFKVLITREGVN